MDMIRCLTVEINGSDGVVGTLGHSNAIVLAHAEDRQPEIIWCFWHFQFIELFTIFINVDIKPGPITIAHIIKVFKPGLSGQSVMLDPIQLEFSFIQTTFFITFVWTLIDSITFLVWSVTMLIIEACH